MKLRQIIAAALVLAVALAGGCTASPVMPQLTIATGGEGGVYYRFGNALAEAANSRWPDRVNVISTAAAVQNLQLILAGMADVGFTTVDATALALEGDPPFRGPQKLAALGWIYDDYLQIVVRADEQITNVADLRGRRVSTGSAGSGTEIVAARVLETGGLNIDHDITRSRLSASDSAQALTAGDIDAFFFTGGLPTPAVQELTKQMSIRILSLSDDHIARLQSIYGEFYPARTIASRTYGLSDRVYTIGIPNVLVVRADMPDQVAYQLTQLLFDAKSQLTAAHPEARRLDQRAALATFPVPLHPGSAAYYHDHKIMA